jgi:hypothetical protein
MAFDRSSEDESGIVTTELVPLKLSAPPWTPVVHVPSVTVPLFPFPDESATVEPVPSSKEYAATRPVGDAELPAGVTSNEPSVATHASVKNQLRYRLRLRPLVPGDTSYLPPKATIYDAHGYASVAS